jgi:hypothetical protein
MRASKVLLIRIEPDRPMTEMYSLTGKDFVRAIHDSGVLLGKWTLNRGAIPVPPPEIAKSGSHFTLKLLSEVKPHTSLNN